MPLHLTLLERVLARLNLLPLPLFDMPLLPGVGRTLVTACELGVFDALGSQSSTLDSLAEQLHCQPEGLQLLLQLLVSSGYLRQRHGQYRNSPLAQRWLTADSPLNIAPYIIHSPDILALWDSLPEVVRTGEQTVRLPYEEDTSDPAAREALARHYAGLASLAMALGKEITVRVRLPAGATELLDVGGSHAAYSVLFCRKYPHLHATILDLPSGIEAGKRTAAREKMEDRLRFVCADVVHDDLGTLLSPHPQYDAALYFHMAHFFSPEVNAAVLAKVAKLLKPGGMLVYVDQVTDQTSGSQLASLVMQLMTLTVTMVGGTCYPFAIVKGWLEGAGMGHIRRHRLLIPGATLITARRLYL